MRTMLKKWWLIALAIPAIALVACTSDSSVQVFTPDGESYDVDEYVEMMENGEVDAMGNRIKDESGEVKTTSSASKVSSSSTGKSSSDEAKSSSEEAKSSSDEAKFSSSEKATSSESKDSSSSVKSSASDEEKSSSSETPKSSETEKSSSSEVEEPSSSETPASSETASSSSEVAYQEETGCSDGGECAIGSNVMETVNEEVKAELDSLKELVVNGETPEGFEVLPEGLTGETFNYTFLGQNDVYCYTGEGEWLHVERSELGKYINHFKNGAGWGQLEKFEIVFMDACTEVYFRHK